MHWKTPRKICKFILLNVECFLKRSTTISLFKKYDGNINVSGYSLELRHMCACRWALLVVGLADLYLCCSPGTISVFTYTWLHAFLWRRWVPDSRAEKTVPCVFGGHWILGLKLTTPYSPAWPFRHISSVDATNPHWTCCKWPFPTPTPSSTPW